MNIRQFQGWALISSAFIMVVLLAYNFIGSASGIPYVSDILIIMYCVFFIVGLPGIQAVQPKTKNWGKIGLALMLIPPLDELIITLIGRLAQYPVELNHLVSSIWNALASVGIIYSGYILVGWLTIRARVFPAWVGWLLFIVGIINDILWFYVLYGSADSVPFSVFMNLHVFISLLEVVALVGYGVNIITYRVPRKKRTQQSV